MEKMSRYGELANILPIGSMFIILCSSAKHYLYYRMFNINIADFIGINEFFILFIDDLLYYALIYGIVGVAYYLFLRNIKTNFSKKNQNDRLETSSSDNHKSTKQIRQELQHLKQEKDTLVKKQNQLARFCFFIVILNLFKIKQFV